MGVTLLRSVGAENRVSLGIATSIVVKWTGPLLTELPFDRRVRNQKKTQIERLSMPLALISFSSFFCLRYSKFA